MTHLYPSDSAGQPVAIIFDVDGTLYHQRPLRAAMLARLVRHAARRPREAARCVGVLRQYRHAQEALRASGDPDPARQVVVAADRSGRDVSEVRAFVERWMEREPLPLLPRCMRPGLGELLEQARARGIGLGVFSDYPAEAKLQALGVRHLFDAVACAQDPAVGRFKPDPAGLLRVAAMLGARPGQTLYVGDRPGVDGAAAERAGMPCVILADRAPPGTIWTPVRNFRMLSELLFGIPSTPSKIRYA